MTKQETFDYVVNFLRKQGCKSKVDTPKYYGPNGTRCAAGCLIPENEYESYIEGMLATHPMVAEILSKYGHDIDLVRDLQVVHDNMEVDAWEEGFCKCAKYHDLDYSPE